MKTLIALAGLLIAGALSANLLSPPPATDRFRGDRTTAAGAEAYAMLEDGYPRGEVRVKFTRTGSAGRYPPVEVPVEVEEETYDCRTYPTICVVATRRMETVREQARSFCYDSYFISYTYELSLRGTVDGESINEDLIVANFTDPCDGLLIGKIVALEPAFGPDSWDLVPY